MGFSQIYELLQHSGSYCKDMYIAQTKLDNIYALHVRSALLLTVFHLPLVLVVLRLSKPVDAEGGEFSPHTCCCGLAHPHTFTIPVPL